MKKARRSIALLLAVVSMLCIFSGCSKEKSKEFTTSTGASITLTDAFAIVNDESYGDFDAVYLSDYSACAILTESIEELQDLGYDEMTENEYAKLLAELYNDSIRAVGSVTTNSATGLESFTYTASNAGNKFYYFVVIKKNATHYCTITFWCLDSSKDKYQSKFEEWAKTIKF